MTDFIIVLRTNEAVKTFISDSHLSIGAGLSAALGVIGRTAEADVRAGPSGYATCYTYSCSKGYFPFECLNDLIQLVIKSCCLFYFVTFLEVVVCLQERKATSDLFCVLACSIAKSKKWFFFNVKLKQS